MSTTLLEMNQGIPTPAYIFSSQNFKHSTFVLSSLLWDPHYEMRMADRWEGEVCQNQVNKIKEMRSKVGREYAQ
jgi:hypothetical protein